MSVNADFHFSHYKSVATISCHSNQSSYPIRIKTIFFVPSPPPALPKVAICEESSSWLQRSYHLKMLTTDGLYYKLTYERAFGSVDLIIDEKASRDKQLKLSTETCNTGWSIPPHRPVVLYWPFQGATTLVLTLRTQFLCLPMTCGPRHEKTC